MSNYSMTEPRMLNSLNTFKRRVDALTTIDLSTIVSHKKVGAMHHWRIGRLGGSLYIKRKPAPVQVHKPFEPACTVNLEERISKFVK